MSGPNVGVGWSGALRSGAVMARDRMLDPSTLGDHIDRLFRAAWALSGSRVDAEDLVQETFAPRARQTPPDPQRGRSRLPAAGPAEHLHQLAPRGGPAAGARGVGRAASSRSTRAQPAGPSRRRGARGVRGDRRPREPFRDALVAVDVAGLSYAEAAELLGTKEATITSRLSRARAQVARGMKSAPHSVETDRG